MAFIRRVGTRAARSLTQSPARLLLLGVMLFALLDLGRSVYARLGYRHPTQPFSGEPFDRDFPWPPGSHQERSLPIGQRLYGRYCASCHGVTGNGLGPAAGNLIPRPRDFRLGSFKYQSTPRGVAPSDEDLVRVIGRGLRASAMPPFDDLLSPQEIRAVAEYVKSFARTPYAAPRLPVVIPAQPTTTPESLAEGKQLFARACAVCHDDAAVGIKTRIDPARTSWGARDLSAPWTWRATDSPAQLWLRITLGIDPGGMPAALHLTETERWKIVLYVGTLSRPAPGQPGSELRGLGQQSDPIKRGEYLTRTLTCTYCHTESVVPMNYNPQRFLAGGAATRAYPDGTVISPNITPDRKTGIGSWQESEIIRALTHGRTPTRSLDLSFKQWFFFQFDPSDAQAISRFLQRVPAQRYRIPPPLRYGVIETVIAKLVRLPLITPSELKIPVPTGPFAESDGGLFPWDWPQELLVLLQWFVGIGVAVGLMILAWQRRRKGGLLWTPASRRMSAACLIVSIVVAVVYKLNVFIPREAMVRFMDTELWRPPPELSSGRADSQAHRTQLARGRYLYQVACLFCHQIDGAGGDRLSDPYAGGFTVRNISSHRTLGVGAWSDEQLERVIRSGIAKDGQQIFWGFMPWDMFSNFDDADLRSLIAYVRTMPAVEKLAAPRELPRPDHPPEITWTIDMSRILDRIRTRFPIGRRTP